MDTNLIIKTLSSIEKTILSIPEVVNSYSETVPEIPVLKDLKNVSQLYDFYRNAVVDYSEVCNTLSRVSAIQIRLRQLKRELNNSSELATVKSGLKTRIDLAITDVDNCRQTILYVKDKFDAQLRFFGATQYMLTSVRYNEIKY